VVTGMASNRSFENYSLAYRQKIFVEVSYILVCVWEISLSKRREISCGRPVYVAVCESIFSSNIFKFVFIIRIPFEKGLHFHN
jgi:hypothetical protein